MITPINTKEDIEAFAKKQHDEWAKWAKPFTEEDISDTSNYMWLVISESRSGDFDAYDGEEARSIVGIFRDPAEAMVAVQRFNEDFKKVHDEYGTTNICRTYKLKKGKIYPAILSDEFDDHEAAMTEHDICRFNR